MITNIPLSWSHQVISTSSLSGTPGITGRVQVTSGTMWCQLLGRMVAVEQLQGRRPPGLCPFANRGLTGSWNGCLTTAAARPLVDSRAQFMASVVVVKMRREGGGGGGGTDVR